MEMNLRQLLVVPAFIIFFAIFSYYASMTMPLLKQDAWHAWDKFLLFVQSPSLFQTAGSAWFIRWIPIAIGLLWVAFTCQSIWNSRHPEKAFFLLWTNSKYMVFTTVSAFLWMLFVAYIQYYNMYWDATANCVGLGGYFAHMMSGFGITVLLYNVNLMDIFKLKGRRGRIVEVLLILAILMIVAIHYEYTEALNPEKYWSELVDMRADMFCNIAGWGQAATSYQLAVPYEE